MNDAQKRIQANSKAIGVVVKVLRIVLFFIIGFEVAGLIWYFIAPYTDSLQLKGNITVISPLNSVQGLSTGEILIALGKAIFQQGVILAVLFIAGSIFSTIENSYSPFVDGIAKKMKIIALLLLLATIFSPFGISLTNFLNSAELESVLQLAGLIGTLAVAGICYCFAIIFDYGYTLQQENDETL
jgi:hypothetical protein